MGSTLFPRLVGIHADLYADSILKYISIPLLICRFRGGAVVKQETTGLETRRPGISDMKLVGDFGTVT